MDSHRKGRPQGAATAKTKEGRPGNNFFCAEKGNAWQAYIMLKILIL
jgi:hypothetical protein